MKAIERLEKLLDEKDEQIALLEERISDLEDRDEQDWEWARHRVLKEDKSGLPVPRLEIRWVKESDYGYLFRWDYSLIYKHLLGHLVVVPFGQSRCQGGNGNPPIHNGRIMTPFRDGVHICEDSRTIGLPAFAIVEETITRLAMENGKCVQYPNIP